MGKLMEVLEFLDNNHQYQESNLHLHPQYPRLENLHQHNSCHQNNQQQHFYQA